MNQNTQENCCRPSGNPKKTAPGVGMPTSLYLQQFGDLLWAAFGEIPYQVGSSLTAAIWRDVDVRVMLPPDKYKAMGFGDPKSTHRNKCWRAHVMAFSALGRQMTGLPIDFQIQEINTANAEYDGRRSALFTPTTEDPVEK